MRSVRTDCYKPSEERILNHKLESNKKGLAEVFLRMQGYVTGYVTDMDINKIQETLDSLLSKEFDLCRKHKLGVYCPDTHKIHIKEGLSNVERLFVIMHECAHFSIGDTFLGLFVHDYSQTIDLLVSIAKSANDNIVFRYLEKLGITDINAATSYAASNKNELCMLLAHNRNYLDFIHFCSRLYKIKRYVIENSMLMNEGLATYMSLSFPIEKIDTIGLSLEYTELLDGKIDTLISVLMIPDDPKHTNYVYKSGTEIAKNIFEKCGLEGLIVSVLAATYIPFHTVDLLSCSEDELNTHLNNYYNCDKNWKNFLSIEENLISKAMYNPEDCLPLIYSKLIGLSAPTVPDDIKSTLDCSYRYFLGNPEMLKNLKRISKVDNAKFSAFTDMLMLGDTTGSDLNYMNSFERFIRYYVDTVKTCYEDDVLYNEYSIKFEEKGFINNRYIELEMDSMRSIISLSKLLQS